MQAKKFIICGVPRSWKSTLAAKLAKELHCTHIPCDPIITAFNTLYPHLGITYAMRCQDEEYSMITKAATRFFVQYIYALDKEFDSYVIEWFHIDLEMIVSYFGETHTIIVVGYPQTALEYKLQAIRKYDTNVLQWTYNMDNAFLAKQLQRFIHLSHMFKQKAKELQVTFVDTSYKHAETIQEYVDAYQPMHSLFM